MKYLIIPMTFLFLISSYVANITSDKLKVKELEVKECREIIKFQLENIKKKNLVINSFYNYTTRVQLMIGVDTIDNVFTFEERIKNPIKMKQILKCVKP